MVDDNMELNYIVEYKRNEHGFPELRTCYAGAITKRYNFKKYLRRGKPGMIELLFANGILK